MRTDFFRGRQLIVATMHGKEAAIAPVLERELGVQVVPFRGLDTDRFGTFSGEVGRVSDPLETARAKGNAAALLYPGALVVASEGSFGPHPSGFFLPCDDEVLLLMDVEHTLEIHTRILSTETNFAGAAFTEMRPLMDFAATVGFPAHGLILKRDRDSIAGMVKGIVAADQLRSEAENFLHRYGGVFVETDMRACFNPTRMKQIERAAVKLAAKANQICPQCKRPGFDVVSYRSGLPCELCGIPTRSILSVTRGCAGCQHETEELYPDGKTTEDPVYCDHCNP